MRKSWTLVIVSNALVCEKRLRNKWIFSSQQLQGDSLILLEATSPPIDVQLNDDGSKDSSAHEQRQNHIERNWLKWISFERVNVNWNWWWFHPREPRNIISCILGCWMRSVVRWWRRCWPTICWSWFSIWEEEEKNMGTRHKYIDYKYIRIYTKSGQRIVAYLSPKRQTIEIIPIRFEIVRWTQKKTPNVCYTDIKSFLFTLSLLCIQRSDGTTFTFECRHSEGNKTYEQTMQVHAQQNMHSIGTHHSHENDVKKTNEK